MEATDIEKSADIPAPAPTEEKQSTEEKAVLYERLFGGCPLPVRWGLNAVFLLSLLYLFLLGLGLMGNAFKGMSGKSVGNMLTSIDNPLAGLSIGVLATVLLQSSSTTTSIVVTMVGAGIVNVANAIPIVMGANIGTSVTNSLVSHGHIVNLTEFRLGFQGASAHSSFNLLCVLVLLPLEIITGAIAGGGGMLYWISSGIADALVGASAETFTSPVKILVGPLSSKFIKIDKDLIKGIAKGCIACEGPNGETEGYCKDDSRKDKDKNKIKECVTTAEWEGIYLKGNVVKSGFAADMGDGTGSVVVLVISLIFLCLALYGIVRLLHYLVLSSGRTQTADGSDSPFVRYTRKVLSFNAYLSIFFGMVMTIAVQSSSITTSALVPLVALNIISVEEMLPLTLGANIGTTCTAFLASMVTEKKDAIQIALVHFFFNVIGILIWFPVPFMRRVPLKMAETLACNTLLYRWFGAFYILLVFVLIPLLLFAFSFALSLGPGGIALNVVLDVLTVGGAFVLVLKFQKAMTLLGKVFSYCRTRSSSTQIARRTEANGSGEAEQKL